eukprot:scaffold1487_cov130-Skeletonema_marinoi.AAC.9
MSIFITSDNCHERRSAILATTCWGEEGKRECLCEMSILCIVPRAAPRSARFYKSVIALGFSSTGWLHRQVQQNAAAALQHHNNMYCMY